MSAYQVCPVCDGEGKYVNPAVDRNGITADEFAEDPDFADAYFGGTYDMKCRACNGLRVITQQQYDDYCSTLEDQHTRMMESGLGGGGFDLRGY